MYRTKSLAIRTTTCSNILLSRSSSKNNPATSNECNFENIPSPKGLPIVGTTLSLIMAGSTAKLHRYVDDRHKQLGPVFKENIGPIPCVFVSDPEAMRAVFAREGKYPVHLLPDAWTTYNVLHNASRGLFFMNGEEWLHFRRIMNRVLLKGDQGAWIEESCEPAVRGLTGKIRERKQASPDMEKLLYKWSLDVVVSMLVGPEKYAAIRDELEEHVSYLASTVHLVFETSSKLTLIPAGMAARLRIPRWKKFESAVTTALDSTCDLVEALLDRRPQGLLGKLQGAMTTNELAKIVTDLILAAGDTTAYSMEWALYLVGKNRHVQGKLREQLALCQEKGVRATSNGYLKNVVKESLRLYPVAPFLTRILPEPVTIRGHDVPAGTVLILSIFTSGRDAKYFHHPEEFRPDRWDRSGGAAIVQAASMPFAIGARSCIGKKLAEVQLQLTLAELVNNFDIEVRNSEEVDVVLKMVAVPSERIEFKFTPYRK